MFSNQFYYYKIRDWMVIEPSTGLGQRYLISAKGFHFIKIIREALNKATASDEVGLDTLLELSNDPEYHTFINFLDQIGFLKDDPEKRSQTNSDGKEKATNSFQSNDELYKRLLKDAYLQNRPEHVQIDLESLCNFDCVYCVRGGSIPYNTKLMLSVDDYKRLFDEFEELGVSEVTFSGGEPFLRKDINDILLLTTYYGFKIRVFTNAALITQEHIDTLKRIRLVNLQIGFYGNKQDYPHFTGVDAFDAVWRAVNMVKDNGVPYAITCPLTTHNRGSFEFFKSLENDYNVAYNYHLSPAAKSLPVDTSSEFLLDVNDEFLNKSFHPTNAIEIDPNDPDLECIIGHKFVVIDIIGNVYPCYSYPMPIGNLHHRSLEEIWLNNPELDKIREVNASKVFSKCRGCEFQTYCVRCLAYNMIFTGKLDELNPYTCKMGEFTTILHKRRAAAANDKI